MDEYKSPDIIKDNCFRELDRYGFTRIDTRSLNAQLTAWTFKKEIWPEKNFIIVYTGKEAGMNGIAMNCELGGKDSVNVAATYDNSFSMYKSVPIDVFLEIVCKCPAKEWIERFHAYDVNKTLEVLDGV